MTYHNLFCYAVLKHKRHERNREKLTVLLIYIYSSVTRSSGPVYCFPQRQSHFSGFFWERLHDTSPYLKLCWCFSLLRSRLFSEMFKRTTNRLVIVNNAYRNLILSACLWDNERRHNGNLARKICTPLYM